MTHESQAPEGGQALTATELAEMWRLACADWNAQVGAHPDPWEHFATRLAENNSLGQPGCFPAGEKTTPAEGDAAPSCGWDKCPHGADCVHAKPQPKGTAGELTDDKLLGIWRKHYPSSVPGQITILAAREVIAADRAIRSDAPASADELAAALQEAQSWIRQFASVRSAEVDGRIQGALDGYHFKPSPAPGADTGKIAAYLRWIMRTVNNFEAKTGKGGWFAEEMQDACNAIAKETGTPVKFGLSSYSTDYEHPTGDNPFPSPAVKAEVPDGMVLVSVERLRKVFTLAKMAGDNIVAHSKAGKGMTGWLDDACTYADSAGVEVAAMCSAVSKPPVQGPAA